MSLNMSSKLLVVLMLIVVCCKTHTKTENFMTVTGSSEILKDLKIQLVVIAKKDGIINNDTLLIYQDSLQIKTMNTKALRYNYYINYKDSLYTSLAFDNAIKSIGIDKAKHHLHFLKKNKHVYFNFSNRLIDSITSSSRKLINKKNIL